MQLKNRLLALGVMSALIVPVAHATNGYISHGYGTKSKGMAGAGTALPLDAMIGASNVAGMVWVGQRLDVGAALFVPNREYTQRSSINLAGDGPPLPIGSNPDFTGTVESDRNLFLIPHFAYTHPLDEVSALGVLVYGNGGMNTTYNHKATAYGLGTFAGAFADPPNATTGIDLSQLAVNMNYSRKLSDQLSVGVGAIVAYQMFKARGLQSFAGLVADGNPDALSNRGRDSAFGWGAQLGALWKVNDQLSLGASYQTEIDFGRFKDYSDLFAERGDLDAPAIFNAGLAFKPHSDWTLAFDVQHIFYSDVAAISNNMTRNIELCMQGKMQGQTSVPNCLGGNQGIGFGWDDMTVFKFGVQWEAMPDLALRAGYSYGDQPVPSSGVLFNTLAPAVIEKHFTLGLTKQLTKNAEIDLALMYAPENDLDCGCTLPISGGDRSINIAMDQWEFEVNFGYRF